MITGKDLIWSARAQIQREDTASGFTVYEEDLQVIEMLSGKPRHIIALDALAKVYGMAATRIGKEAIGRLSVKQEGGAA